MFINLAYKGNNTWWKVLTTVVLTTGIFLINIYQFFTMTDAEIEAVYQLMNKESNNWSLIFNLSPFFLLLGLLFFMVQVVHKRSILSLTTTRKTFDKNRFLFALVTIIILTSISFFVSYSIDSSNIICNFKPLEFGVLCVISLLLFPFQIGFEEYLFRGYLMQQIGIVAKNRWIPLVITSVIFGLFHSANPEVEKLGYGIMFFYIGTGLLLGIFTLMDDGIELALGFHLGNNLMAALLISSDFAALRTDALFKYTVAQPALNIFIEMVVLLLFIYPIVLYVFAKKYDWKNWKTKLTGKIYPTNTK